MFAGHKRPHFVVSYSIVRSFWVKDSNPRSVGQSHASYR